MFICRKCEEEEIHYVKGMCWRCYYHNIDCYYKKDKKPLTQKQVKYNILLLYRKIKYYKEKRKNNKGLIKGLTVV